LPNFSKILQPLTVKFLFRVLFKKRLKRALKLNRGSLGFKAGTHIWKNTLKQFVAQSLCLNFVPQIENYDFNRLFNWQKTYHGPFGIIFGDFFDTTFCDQPHFCF